MRKYTITFFIFLFLLLADRVYQEEVKNYSHSFFGVYGKNALVMGKADGSACEMWIYPYKVLHDLRFTVLLEGAEEDPYVRIGSYRFSHTAFEREFIGEKWTISEKIYPAYHHPCVFLVYRIHALEDITLEFSFKPDLSPMWPASIGGKYSYFDEEQGCFLLSESTGKNRAFFGGFAGTKVGNLPAHKLPGGKLRYRIELGKGSHEIPLAAYAGRGRYETVREGFINCQGKHKDILAERRGKINAFLENHLQVTTPAPWINEALQWAVLNLNSAFVDNPDLGEGLIAGYGLSGEGERPGFGWYFGGDGLINSFAVMDYGDFAGAKRELEFLLKYQRKDGKIMHELSQGAAFIDWFGDYGFPFFHGDTTLYFATFLDFYVRRSGDTAFLQEHRRKIDKVFDWMVKVDRDLDGIVETPLAGTGASETGPLRQEMKTDIFLASLSITSWQAMVNIYSLLRDKRKVSLARMRLIDSKNALDNMFWDEENRFYNYAVKGDGSKIKETTIWPAIGMRFGVIDRKKGKEASRKMASPELSADWGSRFLSSKSQYYDPSSYNNGAVWPFLTGFSALALYNYDNPYHALSLLLANLHLVLDFDYGAPTELLSGDIYRPLDQSVPNQVWSSGNTVAAFVEGLLGFEADAQKGVIRFRPAVPLHWPRLEVKNLRIDRGRIDFLYTKNKGRLHYRFEFSSLKGYDFAFEPVIAALHKTINIEGMGSGQQFPLKITQENQSLVIEVTAAGYVYPFVEERLKYGDFSSRPIIEDFRLQDGKFTLDLWGKGEAAVFFCTDAAIDCPAGDIGREGDLTVLKLKFAAEWERKSIPLRIQVHR